eukprot:Anaeramoba_ignava/a480433_5.p1 GENE.a480433_5~~a480433_5.p1  ORF type:complete len:110 (+),score=20.27 a480433_5:333-662(+)
MIFNREVLYENVGQSEELVKEMVQIFVEDAPAAYDSIKEAIGNKSFDELRDFAHGIKGSAMSINAEDFAESAKKLEIAGMNKINDLSQLEIEFDNQYNLLINQLNKVLE